MIYHKTLQKLLDGIIYHMYWSCYRCDSLFSVLITFMFSIFLIILGIYIDIIFFLSIIINPKLLVVITTLLTLPLWAYILHRKRYRLIFTNHEEFNNKYYKRAWQIYMLFCFSMPIIIPGLYLLVIGQDSNIEVTYLWF